MPYLVVSREPGPAWEASVSMREQGLWAEHASFMDALVDDGFVVLGGPLRDPAKHRARRIVHARDEAEVRSRFAHAPCTARATCTAVGARFAQLRTIPKAYFSQSALRMRRVPVAVAAIVLMICLLAGCGRNHGLSRDVTSHLEASGVSFQPSRIHAPVSERGGFLVTRYDAEAAARIISTFALERVPADDARWLGDTHRVRGLVVIQELWGASGRPVQFKLRNGGQFEYFYLLVTPDGEMDVFAEYAYG